MTVLISVNQCPGSDSTLGSGGLLIGEFASHGVANVLSGHGRSRGVLRRVVRLPALPRCNRGDIAVTRWLGKYAYLGNRQNLQKPLLQVLQVRPLGAFPGFWSSVVRDS